MSDTHATPAPEATAPAAPAAEPATPDDGDPMLDELPEDQAVFDRGYVERLRKENQRYRNERNDARDQLKRYEVFDAYEPDDQQAWLNLMQGWVADPMQVAPVFQQIAASVLGDGSDPGGDIAAAQSIEDSMSQIDNPADLTSDKVQEMIDAAMSARDQATAERAAVEGVYAEIRAGGIDPQSREGMAVLWSANNETDGDIAKAIENVKADRQRIIDEYVQGAATGRTVTTPQTGVVASQDQPIQNLDDARKAADAFIRSQVGASSGDA